MRLVSILGDSLSTFEGYNPAGYTVFYDAGVSAKNGIRNVYDTWWAKVNQALHALLCVNNAYSGSTVTGLGFPSACSEERLRLLRTDRYSPDLILVAIGFNDFARGIPVSAEAGSDCFRSAYDRMLKALRSRYPGVSIVCGTLIRTYIRGRAEWAFPECYGGFPLEEYNEAIRSICASNSCYLADVSRGGVHYETLDGTHPTILGHRSIAQAWIRCLSELGLLSPTLESCVKQYHANSEVENDLLSVFKTFARERVLLPLSANGSPFLLDYQGRQVLPLFSSPNELADFSSLPVRISYLRDLLPLPCGADTPIVLNPFSAAEKRLELSPEGKLALLRLLDS